MMHEITIDNILYSTNKDLLQIDVIHAYLSGESYWGKGISKKIVENSIKGSTCYAAYKDSKQIAFARLITDEATFAFLADVFVIPEYQGKGIGKELMNVLMTNVSQMGLRKIMLATRDAQGLYEKYGFKNFPN